MLKFVLRKMLNKKWMVLALLIGNILLVSITAGNPMYTQAVLQRTLTQSLQEIAFNIIAEIGNTGTMHGKRDGVQGRLGMLLPQGFQKICS